MKPRFKITGKEELCIEYPKCNCTHHLEVKKEKKKQKAEDLI